MEDEPKTHKKTYDWLKPHQFKEGNPGGPGRPKGPTLKTWLRDRFAEMPDEERAEFLNQIDPIKAWEMGEGKAESKTDLHSGGQPIFMVSPDLANKNGIKQDGTDSETD